MTTKNMLILILAIAGLSVASCNKQTDIPMNAVPKVSLTYKIFDKNEEENPASLERVISYVSGWNMQKTSLGLDTLVPVITDTIVRGDFAITFDMPTYKIHRPSKTNGYDYYIPYGIGWKAVDMKIGSHTGGEILINGSHSWSFGGSCAGNERPITIDLKVNVDDWNWDGK